MAKLRRLMIVTDGEAWFVRRVASVTKDLFKDQKYYTCDKPIGRRFATLDEAARRAKDALSNPKSRAWR